MSVKVRISNMSEFKAAIINVEFTPGLAHLRYLTCCIWQRPESLTQMLSLFGKATFNIDRALKALKFGVLCVKQCDLTVTLRLHLNKAQLML